MRDLHALLYAVPIPPVTSGFGGFGLAHDRRHRRRQRLRLVRSSGCTALLPGIPPLARGALLVGAQFGAVLIADEAGARAARPVGTAFDAAAHVERPAWAGSLGGKPHDPLRGHRGGQLAFGL